MKRLLLTVAWICSTLPMVACSPTYNWREFRPDDTAVTVHLPCKPDRSEREVSVEGITLKMNMAACQAGGRVFALSYARIAESQPPGAVLEALKRAAYYNLAPARPIATSQPLAGVPSDQATPLLVWRKPQSTDPASAVAPGMQTILFHDGRRVFQASVVGPEPEGEVLDFFFSSIRLDSR